MTKRIINLLFFIVLNVFAASLSGIIPLFSHSANAEAGLAILSVTCQPYDGLVVATNDESPDFRIDENTVALFDGDKKIGLSVGECTPVACGEVGIPLDSSFSAPDKLKVVFGKGFAVSENGARLADEEIWIYESFEEEFSLIRFRKESPADDDPDEIADESVSEESITESESSSESESESLPESESSSESESESGNDESESPPTSESRTKDESNRTPTSKNRESGCKSDIYPCMTTGLFATFTASAFIFFNNKKQ